MAESLIIIPTYNEIDNIAAMIKAVMELSEKPDLLVVDDSSPDGTAGQVELFLKEYPERLHLEVRTKKDGLGRAYIYGFNWALARDYTYIIEMDADFSHDPKDVSKLIKACKNGADVAIGSRYVQGVNVVNWPMKRVLLSWFASKYVQFITGMKICDTTAGFVCYHRKVLETIPLHKIRFVGYAFQIEMKFKAWLNKFNMVEIPVIFTDRQNGVSKMNRGIVKEAIIGVVKMKWKSIIGTLKYKN